MFNQENNKIHSPRLVGDIQVEVRIVGGHLEEDPSGEFWSDPPGGGCYSITPAHRDISQHVLLLLLRKAPAIGLEQCKETGI